MAYFVQILMRDLFMKLTLKFKGAVIRIDTVNQYDINLKDDEISISEVHPFESVDAVCDNGPVVVSTTSDYLDEVLKKVCDKPVVKQVRALLKDDISDTRLNEILEGMKAVLETSNNKDIGVDVADVLLCTAMFVAAGYGYLDAKQLISEHDIKPSMGTEVFNDAWYRWIITGKCGYEPLSRAIGTVK